MTKQEFEELADIEVSDEIYFVIEKVYMNFDRWNNSKKEFADFFNNNGGMQAINKLLPFYFEAKKIREEIKMKQEKLKEMHILYGLYIGG